MNNYLSVKIDVLLVTIQKPMQILSSLEKDKMDCISGLQISNEFVDFCSQTASSESVSDLQNRVFIYGSEAKCCWLLIVAGCDFFKALNTYLDSAEMLTY